ncbi:hypothetical protein QWY93_05290 [Echinicola jeungdonensis]|uniref:ABC transporter ATPase n=1 Tax=Echinicola jeungdonensis TaxID=709343 RepID=A0ABV5J633_9BACT|nr:hypothetical protein [Echinicola jeungdonensis]MDN3668738.1 hypothetical protein [Echinicola jeungdonensis]
MYLPFEQMPESSRVWVYQANRPFTPEESNFIENRLTAFCNEWTTHGDLMPTSFDIKYNQVIVLSVDESQIGASGCSIDSSVQALREIETALEINLLDKGKISFIEKDQITQSSLGKIKDHIDSGHLTEETPVLNPIISTKEDLKSKWVIPAKQSWLNKYFVN